MARGPEGGGGRERGGGGSTTRCRPSSAGRGARRAYASAVLRNFAPRPSPPPPHTPTRRTSHGPSHATHTTHTTRATPRPSGLYGLKCTRGRPKSVLSLTAQGGYPTILCGPVLVRQGQAQAQARAQGQGQGRATRTLWTPGQPPPLILFFRTARAVRRTVARS